MPRGKPEKYLDIADRVIGLIGQHKLRRGQPLPPERKLAQEFDCSHLTVRKALRKLEQDNQIHKVASVGNFVGPAPVETNMPGLVGLILPDDDLFYYRLLIRLEQIFEQLNLLPVVKLTNRITAQEDNAIEFFRTREIRAVIAAPSNLCAKRYEQLRCPVIFFDQFPANSVIPHVVSDDFFGAVSAVEYLLSLGHRRIAYIGSSLDPSVQNRFEGYRTALERYGLPVKKQYVRNQTLSREWGFQTARELLALSTPPTAIFCGNDTAAAGVVRYCASIGRRIPETLSILGFGDTEIAEDLFLSSVSQHSDKLADTIAENLQVLLNGGEIPRKTVIPTTLIVRNSTGPNSKILQERTSL